MHEICPHFVRDQALARCGCCANGRAPIDQPQRYFHLRGRAYCAAERCRSGRTGRSRKPLCSHEYRGFESLPLRHFGCFDVELAKSAWKFSTRDGVGLWSRFSNQRLALSANSLIEHIVNNGSADCAYWFFWPLLRFSDARPSNRSSPLLSGKVAKPLTPKRFTMPIAPAATRAMLPELPIALQWRHLAQR